LWISIAAYSITDLLSLTEARSSLSGLGQSPYDIQKATARHERRVLRRGRAGDVGATPSRQPPSLEVSDDEVRTLIREQAEGAGEEDVEGVVQQIFDGPAREALRDDLRLRAALDRIVAEVKRIPADLARARPLG
jgi:hypothetical protein